MMCDYEYNEQQYVQTTCSQSNDLCSKCSRGMMILTGIISGLVFAAAVVLLFINSLLTAVFPAVLTSLIAGLAALGAVLSAAVFPCCEGSTGKKCIRCHLGGLFFGILGTIASALLAVSTDLAAGSVIAAVTVGLTAFFFAFMLVSLLFLVKCAVK